MHVWRVTGDSNQIEHVASHRPTGQHPLGGGGVKPSFARMANINCFHAAPPGRKIIIMNYCSAYFLAVVE